MPLCYADDAVNMQAWKKRYVMLRDTWYCSPCVVTSLDIYDSDTEPPSLADCHGDGSGTARSLMAGRREPYSLDLRQLTAVGFHLESRRFQFAFYVERCDARPLLFAAESDLEMRCWVAALRMLADKVTACRRSKARTELEFDFYSRRWQLHGYRLFSGVCVLFCVYVGLSVFPHDISKNRCS